MTAINTPLGHQGDSQSFRRGMLAGAAASALLASAMAVGALAAGVVQLPQAHAPAVPAAPSVDAWTDYGERLSAPAAPSVETWADYGERLSLPAAPSIDRWTDYGERLSLPAAPTVPAAPAGPASDGVNQGNPFEKGPARAY